MLQTIIDLVDELLPSLITAAASIIVALIARRGKPHKKQGKSPTDTPPEAC